VVLHPLPFAIVRATSRRFVEEGTTQGHVVYSEGGWRVHCLVTHLSQNYLLSSTHKTSSKRDGLQTTL
jgi:hypothetical protein